MNKIIVPIIFIIIFGIVFFSPQIVFSETFEIQMAKNSRFSACIETNNCFVPTVKWIKEGDTVKWHNEDNVVHNVRSGKVQASNPGYQFDSLKIQPDGYYEVTFTEKEIYYFHCQYFPWMQGRIVVLEKKDNLSTEPVFPKEVVKSQVTKGVIKLSEPKEVVIPKEKIVTKEVVKPQVTKGVIKDVIPKDDLVKSTKTVTPNYSYFFTGITILVILLIIIIPIVFLIRKFKKSTKKRKEERKKYEEYERNRKQYNENRRRQEEERQRWKQSQHKKQDNKQKQYKEKKQYREKKQSRRSNSTSFTVNESLEILGVDYDATHEVIKNAQREMTKKYHPDKHKSMIQKSIAEKMMININNAYDVLKRANRV